jgi:hypothetical protein
VREGGGGGQDVIALGGEEAARSPFDIECVLYNRRCL